MINIEMIERIKGPGFIAALDQSGGSTPKALLAYGIEPSAWNNDEETMFELIHQMRTRVMVNPVFDKRICGAILFEGTMNREVEGLPTAEYLWQKKTIVPFLKVDKGLEEESNGVQRMKPISNLATTLEHALQKGIFGTKMRSVIHNANAQGIKDVVVQQFSVAEQIVAAGLVPIIEPEVNINATDKAECENLLQEHLLEGLNALPHGVQVMIKLTLPEVANFYEPLINHPAVLRVVALSGGYPLAEANGKLAQNHNMIASFSRALLDDLRVYQSDEEYTRTLNTAIEAIYQASIA